MRRTCTRWLHPSAALGNASASSAPSAKLAGGKAACHVEVSKQIREADHLELVPILIGLRNADHGSARGDDLWSAALDDVTSRIATLPPLESSQVAFAVAFSTPAADGRAMRGRSQAARKRKSAEDLLFQQVAERLRSADATLSALHRAAVAFAHVRYVDCAFFRNTSHQFCEAADTSPGTVSANAASQLAAAYARVGEALADAGAANAVRAFWVALCRVLMSHEQEPDIWTQYTPRHLANLAAGLAAFGEVDSRERGAGYIANSHTTKARGANHLEGALLALAKILVHDDSSRIRGLTDRGLALVARCLASCNAPLEDEAFNAIAEEAKERVTRLHAADVALLLNALARRHGHNAAPEGSAKSAEAEALPLALADAMAAQLRADAAAVEDRAGPMPAAPQVVPRDAANALDALGRLRCQHAPLLDAMAGYIPTYIHRFNTLDTVGVTVAYGRLQERDVPVFLTLASHLRQNLARFSPSELAAIATSFARVRIREVRFLHQLLDHVARKRTLKALAPHDAVILLSAWGRLRVGSPEAFEGVGDLLYQVLCDSRRVQEGLSRAALLDSAAPAELSPGDLREVALAYARSRWVHQSLFATVADMAATSAELAEARERNMPWLREDAGGVLCALCRLRWQHAALQRNVLSIFLTAEEDRALGASPPLMHWAQVLHASAFLDAARIDCSLWLRCCTIAAQRLADIAAGEHQAHAGQSALLQSELPLPTWLDEEEEDGSDEQVDVGPVSRGEARDAREARGFPDVKALDLYCRELLFGALVNAMLLRGSSLPALVPGLNVVLGQPTVAVSMPAQSAEQAAIAPSPGMLVHALALHTLGVLTHPAMMPTLRLLKQAMASIPASADMSELQVNGFQAQSLSELHECGLRGRMLTKEAHEVGKIIVRLGGPSSIPPLRQPWVLRTAALGVNLMLGSDWQFDDDHCTNKASPDWLAELPK